MLHISVSLADAIILRDVLESSLVDFRREIWHTDSREFRDMLKARTEAVERMLEELAAATAPAM
jgi:hypothetical protein